MTPATDVLTNLNTTKTQLLDPMMSTTSNNDLSHVSVAVAAFCLGYGAKSSVDLKDHLSQNFDSILIPVYTNLVLLYLALRAYGKFKAILKAKSSSDKPQQDDEAMRLARTATQPVDLTGKFKLIRNENFGAFLAAQGVPWALRGAANAARPTHIITHQGNLITIAIQGPIQSATTYTIGGDPIPATIRGRRFEDSVSYLKNNNGICTTKRACDDGYTVTVKRVLSDDKKEIRMTSIVDFDDESKETIESFQIFQRVD